jgi:putative ABC transport system permease protein
MTLQAAVFLVLVLVGVNLGSLMFARLSERATELAVRAALGADRAALVRLLVVENLVLALVGGALGLGVAAAILRLVLVYGPQDLPRRQEIGVDGMMALWSFALALVTGVLCGLIPALRATATPPQAALRSRRKWRCRSYCSRAPCF